MKTASNVDRDNVLSAGHHLLGGFISKADNALQHALLVLDVVFVGQFERLFQVVDRELALLLGNSFFCNDSTGDQDRLDGPEQFAHQHDSVYRHAAEGQWVLATKHLGHNLAIKEQEEREEHGDQQELEPLHLERHQ